MKSFLLVCALANFVSFLCSTIFIFRVDQEVQTLYLRLLKLNTIALWGAGLYLIWNATPHVGYIGIIFVQIICLVAFWMTAGTARKNHFTAVYSKDQPVKLVRTGLYKYVRHPFYVIYVMTYLSIAFVMPSIVYVPLVISIIIIYIHAAGVEESKFVSSGLDEDYKRYRMETGMFFPKL